MKKPFQFKQFSILQEQSAMKVGTDGVLLGAWANIAEATNILDIGSGTGLLALLCAQRNQTAIITAIEIDEGASTEAQTNFNNSPWAERLTVKNIPIQEFRPNKSFDHIICNPPFFKVNNQLNNNRQAARQQSALTSIDLAECSNKLLTKDGKVSLIFPFEDAEILLNDFKQFDFYLNRRTNIKGRANTPPKRVLIELSKTETKVAQNELTIEPHLRHQYSKEYIELTKEFYLKF